MRSTAWLLVLTVIAVLAAPVAAADSYSGGRILTRTQVVSEADRLAAALETTDELRKLLSDPDWNRPLLVDELTVRFLRERFVASPDAASRGLSPAYLEWCFSTVCLFADRIRPDANLPDFKLAASASVPSWPLIWKRSFAPYYGAATVQPGAAVTKTATRVRLTRTHGSRLIGTIPPGTRVTLIEEVGASCFVETGRIAGFVDASALSITAAATAAGTGEGYRFTQDVASPDLGGWMSPWGWNYSIKP